MSLECVCVGNVRTRKLADSLNVRTQVDIRLFPENEMKKSWRVEEAKNQKFIFLPGLGNFNAAIILKRTLLHGSAPHRGVNKLSFSDWTWCYSYSGLKRADFVNSWDHWCLLICKLFIGALQAYSASTYSNQDLETPCIYGALGSVQVVVRDNVRNLAINLPFFVPFPFLTLALAKRFEENCVHCRRLHINSLVQRSVKWRGMQVHPVGPTSLDVHISSNLALD